MAAIACCVVLLVAWLAFLVTTSRVTPLTWVQRRIQMARRCSRESTQNKS